MDLDTAFRLLRDHNEAIPKPQRLPTATELDAAEAELAVHFHPDYRRLQLEASDCIVGVLEPALVLPDVSPYRDLRRIAADAWSNGAPKDCIPFCQVNGNFYLLSPDGHVGYWDHEDGSANFGTGRLADWIVEDWLELEA